MNWAVQDAKARFSELLRAAGKKPQIITFRGEPKYELRELNPHQKKSVAKPKTFAEILASCPKVPEFEPVLTFKSRIVYMKDVPSGTPLGEPKYAFNKDRNQYHSNAILRRLSALLNPVEIPWFLVSSLNTASKP